MVVFPNFYGKGETRPEPPALMPWLQRVGGWVKTRNNIELCVTFLKERGIERIGLIGFCWGGATALLTAQVADQLGISASSGVHAAMGFAELESNGTAVDTLAVTIQCPIQFLQAGNDPDLSPVQKALERTKFASQCECRTFYDQLHGFCAARGDW